MDYTSIQLDAYNGIKEAGSAATLIVSSMGTYNPTKDQHSTLSTNYPTYILLKGFDHSDMVDSLIKTGDKQGMVPAYGLPRIDQFVKKVSIDVSIGGKIWNAVAINPVEPGGVALLFKLQLRGK